MTMFAYDLWMSVNRAAVQVSMLLSVSPGCTHKWPLEQQ